jgi:diguanylate cyclase (GGDEF)-like protein
VNRHWTVLSPAVGQEGQEGQEGSESPHELRAERDRLREELIWAKCKISELEKRADVDPLLDVFNRRGFERELKRSIAYIERYGPEAALIYIDLDGFKAVNDTHGHRAGDAVLKAVARLLASKVRASDVVARLGGDEFAVVLWNAGMEMAAAKARDLEEQIEEMRVPYGPEVLSVGASAGVVELRAGQDPTSVLDTADKAMYARKSEHKSEHKAQRPPSLPARARG